MISIVISELRSALAGLAKVVSNKSTLECLRCIRLDATPERTTLLGTDLEMYASVTLPEAKCDKAASFLLPLERLQSMVKRFAPRTVMNIEPGRLFCDLGTGRVSENVEAPELKEFPVEPAFEVKTVALPEQFQRRFIETMGCSSTDETRYVLNGILLDVSDPACHNMVGTDGRHLFSANSFTLPLSESVIVPSHKLLLWRGLADLPWAMAGQKKKNNTVVRIAAGNWTMTLKTIEGNYPNWKQVVPKGGDIRTTVRLPEGHAFAEMVNGLPGGDLNDKPVNLVIEKGTVSVKDNAGGSSILLEGATAQGPDIKIRLNRDYLTKAFAYGLLNIAFIDEMSAMQFMRTGRQMVVMPLRTADYSQPVKPPEAPTNQPAPSEPQPERKPMPAINGHTNGAATPYLNGAPRSTTPVIQATDKPAIEVAIEKLDGFKATFREALIGVTEITALLRQSVRDQKAGEKEIHQVRQTLRSLQSVKL
jgi:DNA polymerase III sliding clamp (beta) subunit (PCNA family)